MSLQERTLVVKNFDPEKTTFKILKELCIQGGPVRNIVIKPDHAFVEYEDVDSVGYSKALLDGVQLFGKKLVMEPKLKNAEYFKFTRLLNEYVRFSKEQEKQQRYQAAIQQQQQQQLINDQLRLYQTGNPSTIQLPFDPRLQSPVNFVQPTPGVQSFSQFGQNNQFPAPNIPPPPLTYQQQQQQQQQQRPQQMHRNDNNNFRRSRSFNNNHRGQQQNRHQGGNHNRSWSEKSSDRSNRRR